MTRHLRSELWGVVAKETAVELKSEVQHASSSALVRAQSVSRALSEAARRARFSVRTRRNHADGGFQARRGAVLIRRVIQISFCLVVVVPSLAGAIYYGFVASDQYVSEAKFTVSSSELFAPDSIGSLTGIPALAVVQDTQIVVNYIESRPALEKLEKLIDIRNLFSSSEADWLARFDSSKSIEKLVRYWKHMSDVSIKMPSGIVEVKVRAFTPRDAARIAQSVLDISEALVNEINDRMHRDAVASAEEQLRRTSVRLSQARLALERARNDEGVLDAVKTADALNKLLTDTRGTLLELQQEYSAQRKSILEAAPQMRALKSRIDATASQIAEIESKLTLTRLSSPSESTLAASMTKFAELDLEKQIAERLYAGAAASLELARLTAERKTMYINPFVKPVVPQEAQYPRRYLFSFLIFVESLTTWGLCCAVVILVRNHMA
jgi:capsular polysaccharide transport system permease protein